MEITKMQPIVSIIIPTRHRPSLLIRAINSVLAQTFIEIEVIIVIDGPDEATCAALLEINDPRLRVIPLPVSSGAPHARNIGISDAKGIWVALLDDDDEWLPKKLELQLEAAISSSYEFPIITCHLIARTPRIDYIWPRRVPDPNELISEYLLVRRSPFRGEASIQTSTLFAKREFLIQEPFKEELMKHQDIEWALRIGSLKNVEIEFLSEPLVIHYIEDRSETVSSKSNWRYSLNWIKNHDHLVTPRAYSAFVMNRISAEASQQGDWKAFFILLWDSLRFGQPKGVDFLIYFGLWLIPQKPRRLLRDLVAKNNRTNPIRLDRRI
jgi:glycosyltransferase involved in cell wall biosynthesis